LKPLVFDQRLCTLGEGPLWHPERGQLFWVDILGKKLLSRQDGSEFEWSFPGPVSALGWIDRNSLLVAGDTSLMRFDIETGEREHLCELELDIPGNRSNDGRADPHGGFWIGTMGRKAEKAAGSIYRFYRGELRKLHGALDIPNATCFSPDGSFAHFTDTRAKIIWRQQVDANGWPTGEREVFLDLREPGISPDGAVFDSDGYFWLACWGKSCVIRFTPDGREDLRIEFPATNATCPAFGGDDYSSLYLTTAQEGLSSEALGQQPLAGALFAVETGFRGIPEPRVTL
jgi:sugar lactone lactonase YvrE